MFALLSFFTDRTKCISLPPLLFPNQPHCTHTASGSILQPEQLSPLARLRNPQARRVLYSRPYSPQQLWQQFKEQCSLHPRGRTRHPYPVPSLLPACRKSQYLGAWGLFSLLGLSQQPSEALFPTPYLCNSFLLWKWQWCPTGHSHSPPFWEKKVKCLRYYGEDSKLEKDGPAVAKTWAWTPTAHRPVPSAIINYPHLRWAAC